MLYCTSAFTVTIQFAFELIAYCYWKVKLHTSVAHVLSQTTESCAVLLKTAMILENYIVRWNWDENNYMSVNSRNLLNATHPHIHFK